MRSYFFLILPALAIAACGSDNDNSSSSSTSSGSSADGGKTADAAPPVCAANTVPPDVRNVSCAVTIQKHALQQPAEQHLPETTTIAYCSNPPTSGPHYPVWTTFSEFQQPVEWPYLVHSEEHGAVLLLYKCGPEAPCPEIVDELRKVKERAPADCGGAKRVIIAPDPALTTKVAAAAYGVSLTADCADGPTLDEFVKTYIGKGPEDVCVPGKAFP